MGADKGKKSRVTERVEDEDSNHIDGELVLSIEKLQEVQDELEKVPGMYHSWREAHANVNGYSGNVHERYNDLEEATTAFYDFVKNRTAKEANEEEAKEEEAKEEANNLKPGR